MRMEGVRKAFNVGTPVETEVLHGIDFSLAAGEFCAVMGPSGSGKSTLLNIVGLLDRPTAGRLAVCGQETTELDEAALTHLRAHRIGFVFQYHHLLGAFTALENVMMPMLGDAGFPNRAMVDRATALLDLMGLAHRRDNLATNLSGGEQQRVAVARAFVNRPMILIADEPTGNLDPSTSVGIMKLLDRINRTGTTVVMATHDAAIVDQMRKRVIELEGGHVVRDQSRGVYGYAR